MRTVLYDGSGNPAVVQVAPEERMVALLCEAFGIVFFATKGGIPQGMDTQVMHPEAFLQAVLKIIGPEPLRERWPGLRMTPRASGG